MRIPKKYGESREDNCIFCGKKATTKSEQKLPVCHNHKAAILNDMKCSCGKWLDILEGKFGAFFLCEKCGPRSMSKVFAMNEIKDVSRERAKEIKTSLTAHKARTYSDVKNFNDFMRSNVNCKKNYDDQPFPHEIAKRQAKESLNSIKKSVSSHGILDNNKDSGKVSYEIPDTHDDLDQFIFSQNSNNTSSNSLDEFEKDLQKESEFITEKDLSKKKNKSADQLDNFIIKLEDLEDFS